MISIPKVRCLHIPNAAKFPIENGEFIEKLGGESIDPCAREISSTPSSAKDPTGSCGDEHCGGLGVLMKIRSLMLRPTTREPSIISVPCIHVLDDLIHLQKYPLLLGLRFPWMNIDSSLS